MSSTRSYAESWEQSRRADSFASARESHSCVKEKTVWTVCSEWKAGVCATKMYVPELTEEAFHVRVPLISMLNIFHVYSIWNRWNYFVFASNGIPGCWLEESKPTSQKSRPLVVFSEYDAKTCFPIGFRVKIITWGSSKLWLFLIEKCQSRLSVFRNTRNLSLDPRNRQKFLFGKENDWNYFRSLPAQNTPLCVAPL